MSTHVLEFYEQLKGRRGVVECPLMRQKGFRKGVLKCDCERLRNGLGLANFCKPDKPCPVRERLFPEYTK